MDVHGAAEACGTLAALDTAIVDCTACPRLVAWRTEVGQVKRSAYRDEHYWARPVPSFGDVNPALLIVGLAPGAHGANRTGRMFTGDRSGEWLFRALHRAGFAAQPTSTSRTDGQRLIGARITAAVHCAPPANKPSTAEFATCSTWLHRELDLLAPHLHAVVATGALAWRSALGALRECGWQVAATHAAPFGHGVEIQVHRGEQSLMVLATYHPSQQNTFTGRLTESMLDAVLARAAQVCGPALS